MEEILNKLIELSILEQIFIYIIVVLIAIIMLVIFTLKPKVKGCYQPNDGGLDTSNPPTRVEDDQLVQSNVPKMRNPPPPPPRKTGGQ